ncbi:MAG: hypothetical protein FJZ57_06360 [Chlamydiae bacterium]|nr:hypothetical protein [Chlamydiota bacterium]
MCIIYKLILVIFCLSSCSQTTKEPSEQVSVCVDYEEKNSLPIQEISKEKKSRPKIVQLPVKENK